LRRVDDRRTLKAPLLPAFDFSTGSSFRSRSDGEVGLVAEVMPVVSTQRR
jgi:hypothetical protein